MTLHTSAPAPTDEQCQICSTAIRKAEREKVLQMLIKFKESQGKHDGYASVVLDPIIESLQAQQAGDQHE